MTEPIITLDGVSKHFGATQAVSDVSFQVMPGRCVGWLGPNGSGKTTLIRCMLGLARTTTGTITVRGHAIPNDVREALTRVGAIVEEPRFYPYLSGRANLEVAARFVGGDAGKRIDRSLERVGLVDRSGSKVKEYSLGMRQRLGVARCLLNDPELLILDEPSNGLDPAGIVEFREMIRSFVEQDGCTVFISSHLLDEVQKLADDIAIVQSGKLILHGSVEQLVAEGRQSMRLRVDDPVRAEETLYRLGLVTGIEQGAHGSLELTGDRIDDEKAILITRSLVEAGVGVIEIARERESLEERFLEITAGLPLGDDEGAAS
ncbi:MAG: ABC transporter ATP-binding protein [Thermoleophilia bacterium]